jgi:hypothetical protein
MKSEASVDFAVRACLLLTCSICALAFAFLCPDGKPFADQGFNWYINSGQPSLLAPRLAYAFFCVAVSVSAFCYFRFHARLFSILKGIPQLNFIVSLAFAGFGLSSICSYAKDLPVAVATAAICVLTVFAARKLPDKAMCCLALTVAACAFLIAVVPGLSATPDLSAHFPESIADIESHQAQTTAADLRLAQGCKLFESVSGRYGVLWQTLLGAYTKLVHPLSVGDAMMFTRWLHAVFFALAAIAYLKFARRSPIAASLALLFIAPWMELNQLYFIFPQVTAWRYMGFAVAPLLVLLLERASLKTRCLLLGATAGFALLSDFASGVSITCGLIAYLIFHKNQGSIVRALLLFFSGIGGALGVFLIFFACIFGYMPSVPAFLADLKMTIWQCAGGTAPALDYPFDPLAVVIIVHTAYAAIKLAGRGPRSLVSRDALRLCISVASMLWFVHYVNEPNTFALRACRVLYGFFLIDLLRTLIVCAKCKRETKEPLWMLNLILVAVIIPAMVVSYQPAVKKILSKEKNSESALRKTLVSGVYLPEEVGKALLQKAEFIKNAAHRPVVYLTADSSFVPKLSGVVSFVPLSDPFSELFFSRQSELFMKTVGDCGAEKIYVDDPDFITAKGVGRRSCFDYLRVLLSRNYSLSATQSGWQIWIPRVPVVPNSKTRE